MNLNLLCNLSHHLSVSIINLPFSLLSASSDAKIAIYDTSILEKEEEKYVCKSIGSINRQVENLFHK